MPRPVAVFEPRRTPPPDPEPAPESIAELPDWDGEPPEQLRGVASVTDDAVKDYLKKIGKAELLSAEQEVELAKLIEAGLFAQERLDSVPDLPRRERRDLYLVAVEGRRAKATLITANLRLVVSIAKRYRSSCGTLEFLDLIQDGNQGLNRAVERFDYSHGTKFSTYATWWIRQSITRAMADTSRTIRVPVHVVEDLRKLQSTLSEPGIVELEWRDALAAVAKHLDMTVEEADKLHSYDRAPWSLEAERWLIERDGVTLTTFGNLIVDIFAADPDADLEFSFLRRDLDEVLDRLTGREAEILSYRYGLDGFEPRTLDDIGSVFGVTRERIRQIEKQTMEKLRESRLAQLLRSYLVL